MASTGSRPIDTPCALLWSTLALMTLLVPVSHGAADDTRLRYSRASPSWLQAVGTLRVPGLKLRDGYPRHHTEHCSATLVGGDADSANTIVTAWHCLEFYRDLSHRIVFTLLPATDQAIAIEALLLADGGGMPADWAVLRLRQAVPASQVRALRPHPGQPDPDRPIIMAGYSRDAGIGASGTALSYDPDCRITGAGDRVSRDSNCRAHKGASGGAVIQLSPGGEPLLSGVVSEGDGAGISRFVPVSVFRRNLPGRVTAAPHGD
ncbi:trypsin-like serine peptidase [Kineobactrum salinum]|uniref:Trypsin-like peptidase domain-containing protein n=1 Tax=Kineobactrum salinum TaxID=2708301 RepID=A0A6C0TXF8_9GAMM|nr:trypsin-like peptidase domain-containing protein [Kineobactrum salinum]QIB64512.1 trypsin-like peptidase domain-containing protein [Kineobactrum salinum]